MHRQKQMRPRKHEDEEDHEEEFFFVFLRVFESSWSRSGSSPATAGHYGLFGSGQQQLQIFASQVAQQRLLSARRMASAS